MIILGLFIYSFGFTAFILPQKIVIGGMAGLGSLIYYLTNIPVGISVFVINIILLLIAFKSVSKTFVIRTIFGTGVMSFLIYLMQPLFTEAIVKGEPFMNAVIGSLLCGVGIGIVFIHNGSTGGTDIVAAMVNKHRNVSIGRTMLYCDLMIISSSYFLPGNDGFEKIVYGFVVMLIVSNLCDMVINSSRRSVQFMIFSQKYEEIANTINTDANRGVTLLDGQGWYSKQPVKVLIVLARRSDSVAIFRIIKAIDPNAFISQANVNGVYGQGFDVIK
ncbi:MAG: YitT family protein [Bacteroidales bacterium]